MTPTTDNVNATYDRVAPMYEVINKLYFAGRDHRYQAQLIDRLDLLPGDRVFDLCCGTGLGLPHIRRRVAERGVVVRVDASSQMIRRAQ